MMKNKHTLGSSSFMSTTVLYLLLTSFLTEKRSHGGSGLALCSALSTSYRPGPHLGQEQVWTQLRQQPEPGPTAPVSGCKTPRPCPFYVVERVRESMMSFADDLDGNPHATLRAMNQLCMEGYGKNICSEKAAVFEPGSFRQRLEECADSNEVYVAYEMKAISPPGMPPPERTLFVRSTPSPSLSSPASRRDQSRDKNEMRVPSPPHFQMGGLMDMDMHTDPTSSQRQRQRVDPVQQQQQRRQQQERRIPQQGNPPSNYDFYDSEKRMYYSKGELVGLAEVSHQPYSLTKFGLGERGTSDDANCRPVVNHLVVADRARTSGIGSRLLEACEKHILEFWRMDELTLEVYDDDCVIDGDVTNADMGGDALNFFLKRDFDVIYSDYTYDSNNHGTYRRVLRKFFGPMAHSLKQKQEQKKREQLRGQSFGGTPGSRQGSQRNTGTIVDVSFTDDREVSYSAGEEPKEWDEEDYITPTTMSPSTNNQGSIRCNPIGLHNGIF
jgi:GNAT superfamily N-acetyltransferase